MAYGFRRKSKMGNVATTCGLHSHRSKLEASVCCMIQANPQWELLATEVNVKLSDAKVLYIPDFQVKNKITGEIEYIEAKGKEMARWPTIKKLWKAYGPGKLLIYKGSHLRPVLTETIEPGMRASCPHCGKDL